MRKIVILILCLVMMVCLCFYNKSYAQEIQDLSVNEIQSWKIISTEFITKETAQEKLNDMNLQLSSNDNWRFPTITEFNVIHDEIKKMKIFSYDDYYWSSETSNGIPIAVSFLDPETDSIGEYGSWVSMALPETAKLLVVNNTIGKIEKIKKNDYGCFIKSLKNTKKDKSYPTLHLLYF